MIDLRSDTVTKPTSDMLKYMVQAEVGDDVFAEDPTINAFEQKIADLFGMEDGLFVPSGVMSNQLALHILTTPGDEVIIDELGHVFNYESASAAHLSSIQLRPVKGHRGKITAEIAESAIRTRNEWDPHTRVIAVENTTNKGGGACYTTSELIEIRELADEHDLAVHLDGARIWNAITSTGIEPEFFGTIADTISVCFSKGLGAPVGSMLLCSSAQKKKARRYRKMWGGGMRQTGLLAAAAEYAVENHWSLMKKDHERARRFAEELNASDSFAIDLETVESNIILFDPVEGLAADWVQRFSKRGIGVVPFGKHTIRATFHFQISDEEFDQVLEFIRTA